MSLPKLAINIGQIGNHGGTLGYDYIVQSLIDSKFFQIEDHKESVNVVKGNRGTILYFEGKKIYLDFWEYTAPTHSNEIIDANFDLIIKLQHKKVAEKDYLWFVRRKNFHPKFTDEQLLTFFRKIVPWTFFPSKMMFPYIGKEEDITTGRSSIIGFFCGRNWKARHEMKAFLDKEEVKYICNEVEGARISDSDFMHMMMCSKYGIVLPGRSTFITDSKNRREIDYMMMRKPLLISYHPYYYNELVNGKHFVLIDSKTDLNSLEKMYNMDEIAENAFQWYKENASKEGIAKSFMNIMKDHGYVK